MVNHRHTKGRILDLNSEVCRNSYLDDSLIGEKADVYQSYLKRSWTDNSKLIKVKAEDADIRGCELFSSSVDSSAVTNCTIYASSILYSNLNGVQARGSVIYGCTIDADVQVGEAELVGLTISRPMRIGVGFWDRVPRSFEIKNDIANFVVTESTDGYSYVGCQRKPMARWIKGKERYRKMMGWPQEIIDEIEANFLEWMK